MKSVTIFLTLILVALTGAALATPDDGIDSFGIYFGPDLVTNCASVSLFTPFNLYFMVANPSSPVISSFEVSWHYEPAPPNAPAILGVTFPPNALNIGDDHNFIVGLSSAMPTTPATILVTVALLATSPITDIDIMGCNASYVGQSGEVDDLLHLRSGKWVGHRPQRLHRRGALRLSGAGGVGVGDVRGREGVVSVEHNEIARSGLALIG